MYIHICILVYISDRKKQQYTIILTSNACLVARLPPRCVCVCLLEQTYCLLYTQCKIKKSKFSFCFPSLNKKRDFIHIEDLCRSIIHLMKLEYNGTLNIASGKSHSLNYIIKYFCKKFKKKLILIKNKTPNIDLTADIQKLKKTNFKHKKKIDNILQDYYNAKK